MLFFRRNKNIEKFDWLVAGLGNPGKKYSGNRHNIGWMTVIGLCEKYKSKIKSDSNIYFQSSLTINNMSVLAVMPTTYMNNSGEAIVKISKNYNIPIDRIIVIVDEYNFPVEKIHLKSGGSDGGHNGIASVIKHLESEEFMRLRCGIGKNFPPGGMVDYVLADFKDDEIENKNKMIKSAITAIETIITMGQARAMSIVNSGN